MRPAFSVVAFTVLSGAGLGGLALLCLIVGADVLGIAALPASQKVTGRAAWVALAFLFAGLVASTRHLANPRNAWRSLARWRHSWLSREALSAVLLAPMAVAMAVSLSLDSREVPGLTLVLPCVAMFSWATIGCTAMIYASLKPIRQWHTLHVPAAYYALGHASGALLLLALVRGSGGAAPVLSVATLLLLIVAAIVKLDYYRYLASDERSTAIEEAIGVAHGVTPGPLSGSATSRTRATSVMAAGLFDAGHSRGTFLTYEFGYRLGRRAKSALRALVWAGFAFPTLWIIAGTADWQGGALAFAAFMAGLTAERWLFFAEARHTVRLYHGEDRT